MHRQHSKGRGACVLHKGGKMTTITGLRTAHTLRFDRTLEYAVVQSWDELMPPSTSGLVQIEYQTGADGSVDFLKIWASTVRGHWSLICEFWMRSLWSHTTGVRFANDYHAADLAHALEFMAEHEVAFSELPGRHGLIQINPPTEEERREAKHWMGVAFKLPLPIPMEPTAA
jgi:hypothetical protein